MSDTEPTPDPSIGRVLRLGPSRPDRLSFETSKEIPALVMGSREFLLLRGLCSGKDGNVGWHLRSSAFVGGTMFVAVDNIEPNRRYALVLKLLIVFVSVAAKAGRLVP
jgi:hypothetical protein